MQMPSMVNASHLLLGVLKASGLPRTIALQGLMFPAPTMSGTNV